MKNYHKIIIVGYTIEYVGDGNTTWRTETKENKND